MARNESPVETDGFTTTRLGRIESDDDGDNDDEYDRKKNPLGKDEQDSPQEDKMADLLRAVEALTKIAAMDSMEYQGRLVNNTLPSSSAEYPELNKLTQSIHRFQSATATLSKEYDRQTSEVVELQKKVNKSQARVIKLEEAVTKLHNRNVKLRKKTESEKSFTRKLVHQVRQFRESAASRKDEEDFYRLADKVQKHEQSLRQRSDSNFSDLDSLRQRTDSNFSDMDSIASGISGKSLVTDDGIATVRIHRERTMTWPRCGDDDEKKTESLVVDVNEDSFGEPDVLSPLSLPQVDFNPFAKLLTPRPVQPYSLSFLPPCSLQFAVLPVEQPLFTDTGSEPPVISATAFCVCGYHGFDATVNIKPTLGSRLLAINKVPVNRLWTTQDLEDKLANLEGKNELTFQNDKWDNKQSEILNLAIQEQKRLHPPIEASQFLRIRTRTRSGDNPNNLLGFLNFQNQSSSKKPKDHSKTPSMVTSAARNQDRSPTPSKNSSNPNSEFDDLLAVGLGMHNVCDEADDIRNGLEQSLNKENEVDDIRYVQSETNSHNSQSNDAAPSSRQDGKTKAHEDSVGGTDASSIIQGAPPSIDEKPGRELPSTAEVLEKELATDHTDNDNTLKRGSFKSLLKNTIKASSPKRHGTKVDEQFESAGLKAPSVPSIDFDSDDFVDASSLRDGRMDNKAKLSTFWKEHSRMRTQVSVIEEEKRTDKATKQDLTTYKANEIILEPGQDEGAIPVDHNNAKDRSRRTNASEALQQNFKAVGKFFAFRS